MEKSCVASDVSLCRGVVGKLFFFFVKGELVNSLRFVDHMVSVAVIQFCSCVKAAIDDM